VIKKPFALSLSKCEWVRQAHHERHHFISLWL